MKFLKSSPQALAILTLLGCLASYFVVGNLSNPHSKTDATNSANPANPANSAIVESAVIPSSQASSQAAVSIEGSHREMAMRWNAEPEAVFRDFSAWAGKCKELSPKMDPQVEAEGVRLARERRQALSDLIKRDPEAALVRAVPARLLPVLPQAVRAELEQRVSGMGKFSVVLATPQRGKTLTNSTYRRVTVNGQSWDAAVYGRRLQQRTTEGDSLHGIALDGHMAVLESPLRQLELGELPTPGKPVAVDLRGSHVGSESGPGLTLESGEALYFACCQQDLPRLQHQWMAFGGPQNDGERAKPYRTLRTDNRLIIMRVEFADSPAHPITSGAVTTSMNAMDVWMRGASYGRFEFSDIVVTSVLRVGNNLSYYSNLGESAGMDALMADARAKAVAANAAAWNPANFPFDIVMTEGGVFTDKAGLANLGNKGLWMNYDSDGTIDYSLLIHEMGHNLGLNHAGIWIRPSGSNNPLDAAGKFEPYGSPYDPVGFANANGFVIGHYSAHFKYLLGWLPEANIQTVDSTATVTLFAHDGGAMQAGRTYGVRIPVSESDSVTPGNRDYWLDTRTVFHTDIPANKRNGVQVQWGDQIGSNGGSALLDMTPNSLAATEVWSDYVDAILPLNTTFSDPWGAAAGNRITVRPIASGGAGADKFVTVEISTPNADLSQLALSAGALSPTFSANTLSYSSDLLGATSLRVTPTAVAAGTTIKARVNGGAYSNVASGVQSTALALSNGPNLVEVRTTNGGWAKTYRLRVNTTPAIPSLANTLGAIPDGLLRNDVSPGAPRNVQFTVNGQLGTLSHLAVDFTLSPLHDYASDVRVELIAPNGTTHVVMSESHLSDNSYLEGPYVFADDAPGPISTAIVATASLAKVPAARYRTQNNSNTATTLMTTFAGLSGTALNGTWTLRFTDIYEGSVGCVGAANLHISSTGGNASARALASISKLPSGSAVLTLSRASASTTFQLQRSTNLQSWTNLQTVTSSATGTATHTDVSPPANRAFYRFTLP